ncbi:MAG: circularly permuted type 2 ATP-grasp protein [Zwartia sp.]
MSPDTTSTQDSAAQGQRERAFALAGQLAASVKLGHYDELRDASGALRKPWQTFFSYLGEAGITGLPQSSETIDRLIQQNGITYNVYGDQQDQTRPWSLNALPMLITPADWRGISTSLQQRAKLLNTILQDVYGEQRLIRGGYLPGALILGNPGYMRAMQGVKPLGGVYLHVVAFDIARGPDGRWWVIGQRTQTPSGLGYVLENRLTVSRVFPEAYREMRVQHVASSYKRLLESMTSAAASIAEGAPRFALLTPGPYSETYFEHAYLARYLGLPLVEGADLAVRDDKLYLKTMHGLQRIHGLLRRLDDDFCDPLELRADSSLGVPGLLQAVRAGSVVMANALGTSFLESPAVQGFLPAISEYLLNEPLKMPSLNTWWCGEIAAWQDIAPDLHTQVIKPTYATNAATNFQPAIASLLGPEELDAWRKRIGSQPDIYTTQSYLPFSQAPTWQGDEISPRTAMLRVYAIASGDGEWQLLQGGMTRIATVDPHIVSIQSGGSTLDTWVMTDQQVDTYSMLPNRTRLPRWTATEQLVSSRSAESLFWLGRYTERCELMVRLAKEALVLVSTNQQDSLPALHEAIGALGRLHGLIPEGTPSLTKSASVFGRTLIAQLIQKDTRGLLDNLELLEFSLKAVRDRLPAEHAEMTQTMKQMLLHNTVQPALMSPPSTAKSRAKRVGRPTVRNPIDTIEVLDAIGIQLVALVGFQADRITRDLGWHMLAAGRLIERLVNLSGMLVAFFTHAAVYTPRGFETLLVLFDSSITYRTRYQRQQDIPALMDLLVADETNPRSINCILQALKGEIKHLPNGEALLEALPEFDPHEDSVLVQVEMVRTLGVFAANVSDEISRRFFALAVDRHFAS